MTQHRKRAPLKAITPRLSIAETRAAKPPPKTAESFYTSPEWRQLSAAVKRERGYRCEDCGNDKDRLIIDHVVELKDGGPALDRRNLRCLCLPCHNRKTAGERAKRLSTGRG